MRSIEEAVPAEALSASLYKISLRRGETFAEKVLSAMREDFSGHIEPGSKQGAPRSPPAIFRLRTSVLPNALSWGANVQRIAGKPLDERDFLLTTAKN